MIMTRKESQEDNLDIRGKPDSCFARIDRIEILQPSICSHCGQTEWLAEPAKIDLKQVAQLVDRPIEVVEYHRHHCQCGNCGQVTSASWSSKMIPGQDLGVKLQAFLGWLGNYGHLPYEKQQELLWELGQIEIGLGTIVATNQRVETVINPSVEQLAQWVKVEQPPIHVDETPWPVIGVKEWLWVFTNQYFCLFRAADTRGRAELEAQLGSEYGGVLSSDDLSVYNGYAVVAQQKCLAHLRRHFQRLIKTPGQYNQTIGQTFLKLIDEAFRHYRLWQNDKDRPGYGAWATLFKDKIRIALEQWRDKAGYEAGKLLRNLQQKAQQWWYFLDNPEVPPDNNLAERSLRLAITKRKVSGGSRSMERFKQTANLLTVVQTCRRQGRSVIDFFEQSLIAIGFASGRSAIALHGNFVAPSLIPNI